VDGRKNSPVGAAFIEISDKNVVENFTGNHCVMKLCLNGIILLRSENALHLEQYPEAIV
jgi:hypothetical protein